MSTPNDLKVNNTKIFDRGTKEERLQRLDNRREKETQKGPSTNFAYMMKREDDIWNLLNEENNLQRMIARVENAKQTDRRPIGQPKNK